MKPSFIFCVALALAGLWSLHAAPSPAPIEMTQADFNATVLHRAKLVDERNTELVKANQALAKQLNDLQAAGKATNTIVAVGPDLSKEIDAQNKTISHLKIQDEYDKWKWGIVSAIIFLPVGIAVSIAGYFLTKGTVFAAKIAALA